MKIKIKHPIIYGGKVLQRGRVYDTDKFNISEKHIESWINKRLAVKAEDTTENKADAPEEQKPEEQELTKSELEKKTVKELKEFAINMNIDIDNDFKKNDIINAILKG